MTTPTTPSPERQPADAGGEPAVPIRESIAPDYLICLEDGCKFKSLKRHLRVKYDLSPEQYRAKWGLPDDYPMVAPNYAKAREDLARQLQKKADPKSTPAPQAQPDARAVEALRAANEALALVTAFESDARYIMGNTNFAILQQRREQVKQALQALSAPAAKCSKRRSAEDEYQVREWALIGLYLVEGRTTTDSESGISIEWAFGDKPALLADAEGWALEDAREDYDRIFCDLTNALSAPAADDGWRTIESAPKDGTEIIIYGQGWTSAPRAKWIDRDGENNEGEQITFGGWALASDWECFGVEDGFIGWNEDVDEGRMPTLWMPLPVALHPAAPTDEVGKS